MIVAQQCELFSLTSVLGLVGTDQADGPDRVSIAKISDTFLRISGMRFGSRTIEDLIARRIELETVRWDRDQVQSLQTMKDKIEKGSKEEKGVAYEWEPLPSQALRKLFVEVEAVLKEWNWKGDGRVEFDQKDFDIVVDGQSRLSHGKGIRAILYSAFAIGLLRYCHQNKMPHLGVVVIDSPLTSYKKGKVGASADAPIDPGMEEAFWKSLKVIKQGVQVIIIENKEPPPDVATVVQYEWFAGEGARAGERVGFIPAR